MSSLLMYLLPGLILYTLAQGVAFALFQVKMWTMVQLLRQDLERHEVLPHHQKTAEALANLSIVVTQVSADMRWMRDRLEKVPIYPPRCPLSHEAPLP